MTYLDGLILLAIQAGDPAAGRGVGLVEILERVDANEKWVLTYEELNNALRRLTEAGQIEQMAPGRYRAKEAGDLPSSYAPLHRKRYEAAIERYRDESVDAAVGALRSPGLRIPIAAAKIVYRATGGRFGLAKDWVDLEATSVWIVVERAVERLGGSLGEPAKPRPLEFPVAGIATAAERSELARAVRAELWQRRLATRRIWLRFEDGERVAVSP